MDTEKKIKPYMIQTKNYITEILQSDRYTAYGNFLDRFRNADNEVKQLLINERPINDGLFPIETAKLAATVEVFVKEYDLEMPKWVMDEKYILKEAYYAGAWIPEYKKLLKDTAIEEFAKRHLYLGDNCMDRA